MTPLLDKAEKSRNLMAGTRAGRQAGRQLGGQGREGERAGERSGSFCDDALESCVVVVVETGWLQGVRPHHDLSGPVPSRGQMSQDTKLCSF